MSFDAVPTTGRSHPRHTAWPRLLPLALLPLLLLPCPSIASSAAGSRESTPMPPAEFRARQARAMDRLGDDLLILHARSSMAALHEAGFRQDRTFHYFTGFENVLGAILVIDGGTRRSVLFVPHERTGLMAIVRSDPDTARAGDVPPDQRTVDEIRDWREFAGYVDQRLAAAPSVEIHTDDGGLAARMIGTDVNPPGLPPVENVYLMWRQALQARWPDRAVKSGAPIIGALRAVKSEAELEVLRRAGRMSVAAFRAGVAAITPTRPQREIEAEVVRGCIQAGAWGPSFWPWVMGGRRATFPGVFASSADYRHFDQRLARGDLLRLDVGCEVDQYTGDVGRTLPVNGRFDPGQREVWELLVEAYRASLATIRAGVRTADVFAASRAVFEKRRDDVRTPLGRAAIAALLAENGLRWWTLHGVGLDATEGAPQVLEAGMVVALEPMFAVDGQAFYLEDTVVVTPTGHENLNPGMPYSADEIERAMRGTAAAR